MNLIEQPQDHKDFIFQKLRLEDLINLSLVCKSLHQDETRKKWTLQRTVDGYFYSCLFSSGPIVLFKANLFYNTLCPRKKFTDMRLHRLLDISIRDICKTSTGIICWNNGMLLEDVRKYRKFDIPHWDFIKLDETTKTKILENLFQYLYDMFLYAEKYGQSISNDYSFELFYLYQSIMDLMKFVFCEDKSARQFVWKLLCDFSIKTLNRSENNSFDLCKFVKTCDDTEFTNLDKILEIGSFLKSKDLKFYLYKYLEIRFDTLIDLGRDPDLVSYDECIKDFIQDCQKQYNHNKTKKEYLFDLFRYAEYDLMYEFDCAVSYRLRRYRGEITDIDSDEDRYYDSD